MGQVKILRDQYHDKLWWGIGMLIMTLFGEFSSLWKLWGWSEIDNDHIYEDGDELVLWNNRVDPWLISLVQNSHLEFICWPGGREEGDSCYHQYHHTWYFITNITIHHILSCHLMFHQCDTIITVTAHLPLMLHTYQNKRLTNTTHLTFVKNLSPMELIK